MSFNSKKAGLYIIFISIIGAFAGLIFGVDVGVISGVVALLNKHIHLSHVLQELIVSGVLVGAIFGALFSNPLCKKIGRKNVLLLTSFVFSTGAILCSISPDPAIHPVYLILSRAYLGIALGFATFAAPIYLSELSPKKYRGSIISGFQFMITLGIFVSFVLNTFLSQYDSWRLLFAITSIPAIITLIMVVFLPKSPRWLMMKGKKDQAIKVLHKIMTPDDAKIELDDMNQAMSVKSSGWNMMFVKRFRHVLFLGIALQLFQQLSGINAIMYYAPIIFKMAGFTTVHDQLLVTAIVGLVNMLSTVFTILFIDKFGRRPILFTGIITMVLSLFVTFFIFHIGVHTHIQQLILVASVLVFIIGFAISLGPIAWMICSEIFPLKGREFGLMITTATNWIGNLLVGLTFLSLISGIGIANTFFMFMCFNVIALVLFALYVPETKGISLESIESKLFAGTKLRKLGV